MPSFPAGAHVSATAPAGATTCPDAAAGSAHLQAEVLGLFDEFRNGLLRYAMSFGLPVHDGEDVLQEMFLALFRHLQADRSRENLPGWMYRTTHNLALKRRAALHMEIRRTEQSRDVLADGIDIVAACCDNAPGPEEQLLFSERQQRLRAVLRALPQNDQMCLQLRAEGRRYREIASIVGISLGSVAASLARSFERLRRTDAR